MRKPALVLPLVLALAACGGPDDPAVVGDVDPTAAYEVHAWPLPATEGSAQPDMAMTADGRLLLSWISSIPGRRNALQFVSLSTNGRWQSAPRTIAVGETLAANWANIPHITATPDGTLWVHWLQRIGEGYAADIALSRSTDAGFNWSPPVLVNDDGTATEHGFASLWSTGNGALGIAWLDGRANATDADATAHQHAAKAHEHGGRGTQVRAAVFDANLERSGEQVVDPLACDCCQTAVAMTARGPVLFYRDRTDDEIRDIVATRLTDGTWSEPKPVHADGWKIEGCPVNGPSAAADGNNVVVAWYTGANDTPTVLAARSGDAGDSFYPPVVLEQGRPVLGRVAVAVDAHQAWLLWIREDANGQSLWLSRRSPDLQREYQRLQVAELQGRGNATGFPKIVLRGSAAHIVWTDVADGTPRLHGAIVNPTQGS